MKKTNSIHDFMLDDFVDHKLLDNLFLGNSEIYKKLEADTISFKNNMTYKQFLNNFQPKSDIKNLEVYPNGVLQNITNIIESLEFSTPDKESSYLNNLSALLILKYLTKIIYKTKKAIENKIAPLIQDANNYDKFKYNNLLKKNIHDLFTNINNPNNEDENNFMELNNWNKNRPEAANHHSRRANSRPVNTSEGKNIFNY
jgi:hypothetical protein